MLANDAHVRDFGSGESSRGSLGLTVPENRARTRRLLQGSLFLRFSREWGTLRNLINQIKAGSGECGAPGSSSARLVRARGQRVAAQDGGTAEQVTRRGPTSGQCGN